MNSTFRLSAALVLFLVAFTGLTARSIQNTQPKPAAVCAANATNLSVTPTSNTSVALTWDEFGSAPSFTVTVRNLTTGQVEQSFQTTGTSATVGNLKCNNRYNFEVKENSFIIMETTEM